MYVRSTHLDESLGMSKSGKVALAILATFAMVVTLLFAAPPPPAMAATDDDPSFVLTQNDLEFILRQIQISEAHAADELNPSNYALYCPGQGVLAQDCVSDVMKPAGVRTVDGSYNNLAATEYGASDNAFPRLLTPEWRQAEPQDLSLGFEPNTPEQTASGACEAGVTCYDQRDGIVYDSEPREISNLIVDQTTNNPAIANQVEAGTAIPVPGTDRVTTPNTAPDEELSAPFNTFMGFFGQFFDHGLDLVGKAGSGSMVVPLAPDDSLYCPADGTKPNPADPDGPELDCNPDANFITLSRASRLTDDPNTPADESLQHKNLTSPFIDQNQTYTSHPAHQVFLREYTLVGGVPQATGHLITGETGGMAKWRDVKAQAATVLGIELTDADLLDVPQVLVDPYGNFVPDPDTGFPTVVVDTNPETPEVETGFVVGTAGGASIRDGVIPVGTGHAFLDDIAHGSTPVLDGGELVPRFNPDGTPILDGNGQPVLTGYDNALLDEHYIAGDGRVNENIGLTAVHAVFHAEHNRMAGQIEDVLAGGRTELEAQDSAERGGIAEFAKAFRGEAHNYVSDRPEEQLPGYYPVGGDPATAVGGTEDDWTYEQRLFQAAKFATEMQYQHLVFEEFARKLVPTIDAVVFNENSYNASINAAITAEFAHVVYRFGHSMMTEEIGREATTGGSAMEDVPLLSGFLNPELFDENGTLSPEEAAGSLVNGMTSKIGSQIDEHVVDVLRNNLLGLPLDLPTLNLLRGRDVGVPPLQEARRTFFAATNEPSLAPYANWTDFGLNTKNGNNFGRAGEKASLVNFVAAYGKHISLENATTLEEKRNAAALLVNGAPLGDEFVIRLAGPDRYATAAEIARRHFLPGPVPVAYIAPGANFPDALAGGALAAATGGPILLAGPNDTGEIPLATVLALAELNPARIVVLGGPGVVGPNTVAALNSISTTDAPVTRLAGADRFETAAAIAGELEPGGRVFIADGMNFPDALAGAAVAASAGSAVLLVTPTSIPAATATALTALNPSEIVILGQTGAVSAGVASQLGAYTDGEVIRLGGSDRYATALAISGHFFPSPAGADRVYLATGANFPDALTATPGAGINGSPVLLVPPTGLTPALRAEIARLSPDQVFVLGGTGVVSEAVEEELADFAPAPLVAPDDRFDFMDGTGAYADVNGETVTGLEDVDFWVGGLAERLDPFGGMLGSSFNFVFETQLEKLQFGDRFYYLFRNQGEQLFAALEGNTFSDIIQRNTDASNLPADIFALQDPVLDIDEFNGTLPAGLLQDADGTYRWVGDEHIELHGTTAADRMRGDEGDDSIWGYEGNDRIEGGSGNDALVGGSGDDILTDSFGDDNLKGKQGNDAINVGPGVDLAIAGSGDDFVMNGGGDGSTVFAGLGDDIVLGTSGRTTVFGGEHNDWVEGSSHADLLQGDNADQAQNDTLGGNDVVSGRLGNDDIEGEGGDDILIGEAFGTDRHLGNLGFDWLTYYGQTTDVTSDWAFNRIFETQNQLASRYDLLEALSGGAGNDTLRGPLVEPDDFTTANDAPLNMATEATFADDFIGGFREMLQPTVDINGVPTGIGDFTLPLRADGLQIDADGVHKVMIGGPGSDVIEGRGGFDYLDGDAMLRVRLTDGTNFYDSAAQLQAAVFAGTTNPGTIDIVRDIVYDTDPAAVDTAEYADTFAAYAITPIAGDSGYWRVEHVAVQEAEESDGVDVIRGFERLRFADGSASLIGDQLVRDDVQAWVSIEAGGPAGPGTPTEGFPVVATIFADEAMTTPIDPLTLDGLQYTWWVGEGDTADTVSEWEVVARGLTSPSYVPNQDAVGQFLRVTASWTDAAGQFVAARSAVSEGQVIDVPVDGVVSLTGIPIVGSALGGAVVSDADGISEDLAGYVYQWRFSATDPGAPGFDPASWTDIAGATGATYAPIPGQEGGWLGVLVSYADAAGTASTAFGYAPTPIQPDPTP